MAVKVDKETIICALTATDKRSRPLGKEARNEIQLGYGLQQHLLPERDIGKVCRDFLLDAPLSQSRFLIMAYGMGKLADFLVHDRLYLETPFHHLSNAGHIQIEQLIRLRDLGPFDCGNETPRAHIAFVAKDDKIFVVVFIGTGSIEMLLEARFREERNIMPSPLDRSCDVGVNWQEKKKSRPPKT